MAKCRTCGYNSGKKNHSCALKIKRKLKEAALLLDRLIKMDSAGAIRVDTPENHVELESILINSAGLIKAEL